MDWIAILGIAGIVVLAVWLLAMVVYRVSFGNPMIDRVSAKERAAVERRKVSYYSRKYGWRHGYKVYTDWSGRVFIDMGGYMVRRQSYLVQDGWPMYPVLDPNLATSDELVALEEQLDRIRNAAGFGAVNFELEVITAK